MQGVIESIFPSLFIKPFDHKRFLLKISHKKINEIMLKHLYFKEVILHREKRKTISMQYIPRFHFRRPKPRFLHPAVRPMQSLNYPTGAAQIGPKPPHGIAMLSNTIENVLCYSFSNFSDTYQLNKFSTNKDHSLLFPN